MGSAAMDDFTLPGPLCQKASAWIHDPGFQHYASRQTPPQGCTRYANSRTGAAPLICDPGDVPDLRRLDLEPNVGERLAVLEADFKRWAGRGHQGPVAAA